MNKMKLEQYKRNIYHCRFRLVRKLTVRRRVPLNRQSKVLAKNIEHVYIK